MAHELMMDKDGNAHIALANGTAWHGLGVVVEELMTSREALDLAMLDWRVEKRQLHFFDNQSGELKELPDSFTTIRIDVDEEHALCRGGKAVGKGYEVFQNTDAFQFLDELVNDNEAIIEVAGALGNGERVWVLAKIPGHVVVGDNDPIMKYILISNTHDGTGSIRILPTPIRVVCNNTLTWATEKGVGTGVSLRHTKNVMKRVDEAKEALKLVNMRFDSWETLANRLTEVKMNEEQMEEYFISAMGLTRDEEGELKTRGKNILKSIKELLKNDTNKVGSMEGTAWAAYNALTEYIDFHAVYNAEGKLNEKKLQSSQFGGMSKLKQKAWKLAVEMK